jgi:hypothetical protein
MKRVILFCLVIGSSIAGYCQPKNPEQYYKQWMAKAEKLNNEIKSELDRETRFTLSSSSNNQYVYVLRNSSGQELGTFTNENNCRMRLRNIEMRCKSLIDDLYRDISRYSTDRTAQNQMNQAKEQVNSKINKIFSGCSCSQKRNPKYRPPAPSQQPAFNTNTKQPTGISTPQSGTSSTTLSEPEKPFFQASTSNGNTAPQKQEALNSLIVGGGQVGEKNTLASVSPNFGNTGQYAGGIYVGNANWKSGGFAPVKGLERRASDYTLNKLDAIKNEIAVDLTFRNEVADPIQSFLENRTSSIPQLMDNLYKERTGYDIEKLRNKQYLTEDERKIVEDYNHFVKQMAVELDYQANEAKKKPNTEKNLIDFAIMANDVYNDGSRLLEDTDWKPIISSQGIKDNALAQAIDAINSFNAQNNNNSGFYAQIYKNELTGEYTLAFRGSEMTAADWKNNIQQGFSAFSEQYAFAASIGECLSRSNAKINIVGHSLGGGLATVVGLQTGFPTYTYNQADISQGTVDRYKLDVSKTNNITAYYAEGEMLTTLQNETREYNTLIPLGKKVKTGYVITEESIALSAISKATSVVPDKRVQAVGTLAAAADKGDNLLAMYHGHRMPNMEQYFRSKYSESQVKWEGYNNVQLVLKNNNTYSQLLIDTK